MSRPPEKGRPPKKGIVDPWRVAEPFEKPKPAPLPTARRINISEVDFDADLKVAEVCYIRSPRGTIEVKNKRLTSGNDALRDLVQCLFQILEEEDGPDLFEEINVGFKLHGRAWLEPAVDVPAASIATSSDYVPEARIWFLRQPFGDGMLRLIKLLNAVQRRPGAGGEDILKKWGITPMMRS